MVSLLIAAAIPAAIPAGIAAIAAGSLLASSRWKRRQDALASAGFHTISICYGLAVGHCRNKMQQMQQMQQDATRCNKMQQMQQDATRCSKAKHALIARDVVADDVVATGSARAGPRQRDAMDALGSGAHHRNVISARILMLSCRRALS